jgi:hypothetical protein
MSTFKSMYTISIRSSGKAVHGISERGFIQYDDLEVALQASILKPRIENGYGRPFHRGPFREGDAVPTSVHARPRIQASVHVHLVSVPVGENRHRDALLPQTLRLARGSDGSESLQRHTGSCEYRPRSRTGRRAVEAVTRALCATPPARGARHRFSSIPSTIRGSARPASCFRARAGGFVKSPSHPALPFRKSLA